MMKQTHVIGRQVFDLEVVDERDAFTIQERVDEVFRTHVVPAMTALLDRYSIPDVFVRLDRLQIDIGHLDLDQIGESFATRVCSEIEPLLAESVSLSSKTKSASLNAFSPDANGNESFSTQEHTLALWQFTLSRGFLPWWAAPTTVANLETQVQRLLGSLDRLPPSTRQLLRTSQLARQRLVLQSSRPLLRQILMIADVELAKQAIQLLESACTLLDANPVRSFKTDELRRNFWALALNDVLQETSTSKSSDERARAVIREAVVSTVDSSSVSVELFQQHLRSLAGSSNESKESPNSLSLQRNARELIGVMRGLGDGIGTIPVLGGKDDNSDGQTLQPDTKRLVAEKLNRESKASEDPDQQPGNEPEPMATTPLKPSVESQPAEDDRSSEPDLDAKDQARAGRSTSDDTHDLLTSTERTSSRKNDSDESISESTTSVEQESVGLPSVESGGSTEPPIRSLRDGDNIERTESELRIGNNIDRPETALRDRNNNERSETALRDGESIYVDGAGMILLHPYLRSHFEKLELCRGSEFVNESCRESAVHQLRFLATGQEEMPEYLLVLPKILCGLNPDAPIAREVPRTERAKSESDVLLNAVVRNWGALKNSSPDGLRETFLRRDGRLTKHTDGWRLRVESRSYDLLLDKLPWSIGMIKLPWMSELLRVDWT